MTYARPEVVEEAHLALYWVIHPKVRATTTMETTKSAFSAIRRGEGIKEGLLALAYSGDLVHSTWPCT